MTTGPATRGWRLGMRASVAAALLVGGAVASGPTVTGADPSARPTEGGTPFGSGFGYTMTLPAGWQVTSAAGGPAGGEDLFAGPGGMSARVGGGPADPSHTLDERVAANRDEATADGTCVSDPAEDAPTTLGGEAAIAWSWTCPDSYHAAVNTLHDGLRLRLQVNVPLETRPDAASVLEAFRSTFAFVGGAVASDGGPDLAALEGALEGSYETQWHPVALELAAVESAGLSPTDDPAWEAGMAAGTSIRHVIRFEDGSMTEYCAMDDMPLEICWSANYRLLGPDTLEAIEGTRRTEYRFTLRDGILTLDVLGAWRDGVPDENELIPHVAIFETLPFTRVP